MYNKQKGNGALTREKLKCHNGNTRKCKKKYTSLKLQYIITEKRKLREVVRKRGKFSLYPYFHP